MEFVKVLFDEFYKKTTKDGKKISRVADSFSEFSRGAAGKHLFKNVSSWKTSFYNWNLENNPVTLICFTKLFRFFKK